MEYYTHATHLLILTVYTGLYAWVCVIISRVSVRRWYKLLIAQKHRCVKWSKEISPAWRSALCNIFIARICKWISFAWTGHGQICKNSNCVLLINVSSLCPNRILLCHATNYMLPTGQTLCYSHSQRNEHVTYANAHHAAWRAGEKVRR